jgi:hypothetical protein
MGSGVAQGDADACDHVQLSPFHDERPVKLLRDPLGHLNCLSRIIYGFDEHDELVASEPGQGILRAQAAP